MAQIDTLQTVDLTRTNWRIRVRVSRMWASFVANDNTFIGMNLILLDALNYHVHAFAFPDQWNLLQDLIHEGNCYEVFNFITTVPTQRLRPVSSNIKILFSSTTMVTPMIDDDAMFIPVHKFELVDFEEIANRATTYDLNQLPVQALDVVGEVKELEQPMILHTIYGIKQVVRLMLFDGSRRVKVTIWNEQIGMLDPLFHDDNIELPRIIIIASCKASYYRGNISLSSINSTRIYINPDHQSVILLKQRLLEFADQEGFM